MKRIKRDKDTFWVIVNPCGGWGLCFGNAGGEPYSLEKAERFNSAIEATKALQSDGYSSACRVGKVEITTKVTY